MGEPAPLISIVVPVYNVAGYLRECLDSILRQNWRDFELIAVDDQSPDHSGQILDEYAERDPRVRVLHLPHNVGLGLARGEGMRVATGEYVWFVDSDDWLADGALRAVVDRLRHTGADMLLFASDRVEPTGVTRVRDVRGFLDGDPEVFTAAEQPGVLRLFHTAWARVTRRTLIADRADDVFTGGWYEDTTFTLPLLVAARRIAVLPRVCYHYRERAGAITMVASPRVFEVFEQYERLFAMLDRWGLPAEDPVRGHLWSRMLEQYLYILRDSSRVPPARRHDFFRTIREHYRRWRPRRRPALTGSLRRRAMDRLERSIVAGGWWSGFQAYRTVRRLLRWGRDRVAASRAWARPVAEGAGRWVLHAYYRLQLLLPMDRRLAVYFTYWGTSYGCNPAAVYEKARELVPSVKGVWLMQRSRQTCLPPDTPFVLTGTFAHRRALARAKYLVTNVSFPQYVVHRKGAVHLQTHHGTPLKKMGMDHRRHPLGAQGMDLALLLERTRRWDLSVSTSPFNTEVWQRSYPGDYETLEVGYPRNDRLHRVTTDEIARLRRELGIEPGQTAVLYVPTHREYTDGYEPSLDVEALADELGPQVRVLARVHHLYAAQFGQYTDAHPGVVDVSAHPRVEDLYLAADAMITDYSSAMFDYAHLDRPIVIFAPDWDAYRLIRGVNFDLLAQPPGEVATTIEQLVAVFRSGAFEAERAARLRTAFRDRFCPHRHGRSAELVVRRTFSGALPVQHQVPSGDGGPSDRRDPDPNQSGPGLVTSGSAHKDEARA